MSSKLNHLLRNWPAGTVALQSWLNQLGIDKNLARGYRKSNWLESIGRASYKRAGDEVDWKGAVFALQHHANLSIWPGGLTALSLDGFAHYLPVGRETVWLYGKPGERLPAWFKNHDWGVNLKYHAPGLFDKTGIDLSSGKFGTFVIQISSPERAAFELLYLVPHQMPFEQAAEVVQGLLNLRPRLMQLYLESCRSIKVKRLVLFLANYYKHPWIRNVVTNSVDLGTGKRQIVKSGRLDKRFLITVPEDFVLGS